MKKIIGQFFVNIRQKFFNWRVNRQIFHQISQHLHKEANNGYPFESKDDIVKLHIRGNLHAGLNLRFIDGMASQMPKFQGDAFRYIAYRDLNERMEMYLALAEKCVQPETSDPRFVATHA